MPSLGDAVFSLRTDIRAFQAGMRSAQRMGLATSRNIGASLSTMTTRSAGAFRSLASSVATSFNNMSAQFEQVGRRLTLTGAVIAAPGVIATKMAATFDLAMTKIVTLVGIASEQVNEWRDDIVDLARETGRSAVEIADAMFVVTSGGARGADALELLDRTAKLAAIGLGQASDIARVLTQALQAYGTENLTAEKAADILLLTVRKGNLETSELATSLGRVLPIAAELGIQFSDLGSFIATYTRVGGNAFQATTSLVQVLSTLIDTTTEGKKILKGLGLDLDDIRKTAIERGLAPALIELKAALDGNLDAISEVVPSMRALRGFLAVTGNQAQAFAADANEMKNAIDEVNDAFEFAAGTAGFRFNQAFSNLRDTFIAFGAEGLPVIAQFLDQFRALLDVFTSLPGVVKGGAVILSVLAGSFIVIVGLSAIFIGQMFAASGALIAFQNSAIGATIASNALGLSFITNITLSKAMLGGAALAGIGLFAMGAAAKSSRGSMLKTAAGAVVAGAAIGGMVGPMGAAAGAATGLGIAVGVEAAKSFGLFGDGITKGEGALTLLSDALAATAAAQVTAGEEVDDLANKVELLGKQILISEDLSKASQLTEKQAAKAFADTGLAADEFIDSLMDLGFTGRQIRRIVDDVAAGLDFTTQKFFDLAQSNREAKAEIDETAASAANAALSFAELNKQILTNINRLAGLTARSVATQIFAARETAKQLLSGIAGQVDPLQAFGLFDPETAIRETIPAAIEAKEAIFGIEQGIVGLDEAGKEAADETGGVGAVVSKLSDLEALLEVRNVGRFRSAFADILQLARRQGTNLDGIVRNIDFATLGSEEWATFMTLIADLFPGMEAGLKQIAKEFELPGAESAAATTGSIATNMSSAADSSASLLDNLNRISFDRSLSGLLGQRGGVILNQPITPLASGIGSFRGGAALLGEQGPEIAVLPRGTRVLNAGDTAGALTDGGTTIQIDRITIESVTDVDDFLDQLDRATRGGR